ncbi:sugar phosphate isomerase/epimerase family protein [Taklimakanibacter deserti]|uniref:sugar phosphate isomerase/epimerase family protein n=1 Tax=Taklimakanibacter deserti TaxID=2267839 RepID=UPI000E647564
MKSCFHSVGLPSRPLHDAVSLIADAGYEAIELNAETLPWAPAHITPAAGLAERKAVAEACRARGLAIPAVGAHIGMVSEDPVERVTAINFVKGCIDIARDVGSPFVHILSGPLAANIDRDQAWGWFTYAVELTTIHAGERGIGLGIEAIAGHLFHEVDDYHRIRRDLPGVPFKVNFDPSHLEVQKEDPRRVVDELGDLIAHVHLKDGKGLFPQFEFPPLGEGTIDFRSLIDGLRRHGFDGALSIEYEAQVYGYSESEEQILSHGRSFFDRLIA